MPAGKAASSPSVRGSPSTPPATVPTAVPSCQKTKIERPAAKNARRLRSGVGCASANAVDSSITSWLASARPRTVPRRTGASEIPNGT